MICCFPVRVAVQFQLSWIASRHTQAKHQAEHLPRVLGLGRGERWAMMGVETSRPLCASPCRLRIWCGAAAIAPVRGVWCVHSVGPGMRGATHRRQAAAANTTRRSCPTNRRGHCKLDDDDDNDDDDNNDGHPPSDDDSRIWQTSLIVPPPLALCSPPIGAAAAARDPGAPHQQHRAHPKPHRNHHARLQREVSPDGTESTRPVWR
jgi:hypothetical protein